MATSPPGLNHIYARVPSPEGKWLDGLTKATGRATIGHWKLWCISGGATEHSEIGVSMRNSVAGPSLSSVLRPLRVSLLIALSFAAMLVASSTLSAATAPHPQFNYLWSIPSASGSLTGPNDQHLVLRLVGLRDYMTRFTDRPVRQAYVVANADFVRRFKAYFADANPNAVLSFSKDGNRVPTEIVLQIGQPQWNPKTSTLTFPAVRIPHAEDDLPDTTVHIKPTLIRNPRHFDKASLFIDSCCIQ